MAAEGVYRGINIHWTNPTAPDLARIQVWVSASNDRAGAVLLATPPASPGMPQTYRHAPLTPGVTRYYWIMAQDWSGNLSPWTPSSATDGWVATATGIPTGDVPVVEALNHVCQGRVSTVAGTAVPSTDVLGATTLYWVPYLGDLISLYDGSQWTLWRATEANIPLGTLVTATNYDIFAWDNGGILSYRIGPAWVSDTARGTGAGTTELALQQGVYVNAVALSAGPAARAGRYLATFRTTSTTTTEDSFGQVTTQVGGKRFVWNMYNRVSRAVSVKETTEAWAYTTGTWRQANGATGMQNCVEYVVGLREVEVRCEVYGTVYVKGNAARTAKVGVGVNSVTGSTGLVLDGYEIDPAQASYAGITALYSGYPRLGYTVLAWLESGADGTSVFNGFYQDAQSGMLATLLA